MEVSLVSLTSDTIEYQLFSLTQRPQPLFSSDLTCFHVLQLTGQLVGLSCKLYMCLTLYILIFFAVSWLFECGCEFCIWGYDHVYVCAYVLPKIDSPISQ